MSHGWIIKQSGPPYRENGEDGKRQSPAKGEGRDTVHAQALSLQVTACVIQGDQGVDKTTLGQTDSSKRRTLEAT